MPINFPIPSSVGELYTFGQTTWEWSGEYWGVYSAQTGYVTSASTTGSGYSGISGLSNNTLYLKSFSGTNVNITDDGSTLTFSSFNNTNNTIRVALTGSTDVDFNSIKDAVNSITGATSANTYTVQVAGGVYYEDPFTIPSWVAVVGESSISTVIQANDSSQTLIRLSDQSALFDCQVQGCTDTNVSAILYSSSTTPQSAAISYVENVRFGSNYTHAKVVAFGGANIIMQCSNVKYGGQPFTVGFYATNSGSGIGRMQLRNVTSTNGGIVTTTGLIFAKADAANCGFIVNGCLLTKAAGAAAGTGFYVENGGFLRLTAVNFQRWAVGIDAPQIGSAPSIDAIALNFENNTIDVNIAHSGATGKIQGTDNFLKTIINQNAPLYEVNQDPKEITVAKKGGDFSSIKSAVDYLIASGNTSSDNRYVISVGPGVFVENEIDLTQTPFVSIVGSNIQTTQILPNTNTQHIIKIGINNEISFLSLSGAPAGYAGIYCYDIGDFGQAHKISMYDCDTNIWIESDTQDTKFYGEYIDYNGEYTYGTKVIGNNGYLALANMENYFNFPTGGNITYCNYASGSGATLSVFVGDSQSNGVSGSTAYLVRDGAGLYCSTITVDGFTYGVRNPNEGLPIRFDIDNASFVSGEWDLYVERLGTFGTFGGSSNHEKVFTVSEDVYWAFLDIEDGEFDITRKASVTFQDGSHTDFTTLIFEGGTMGLISGGSITTISGFTVQADAGFGYLEKSDNSGIVRRIDWVNNQITLSANTDNYIYINENSNLVSSGTKPITSYNILLGRVVTDSTGVEFIDLSPMNAQHTSNSFDSLFTMALGPIYAFGSIVTEGTTPFTLNVSQGDYHFSTNVFLPSGGTGITFTQYYRNGTGSTWVTSATTLVNNTQYDNNGTLTGLTTGYFTKHTLYTVGQGSYENYFLVIGQNEYATLVEAEDALLTTPPSYFTDGVVQIANIYIQEGTSGITQVEDIRPTIGFRAGGVNASSVHGNLLGLNADDHTQYLLGSGARAMSGNLDMGVNDITNVGTVDGVTVSSHATRHQFGGLDPVGSTTPSANAIPYADVSGTLNDWISTASTTTFGKVKTSSSNTTVISDDDSRFLNSFTGGSYSNGTLSLNNNSGGTYNVTGFFTGGTDVFVTGGTYSNGLATFRNNTGGTFNVTGFFTGGTDVFVTGGTYSSGSATFTNNTGGTFNVTGFFTGGTDVFVTGGTYSNGSATFTNNTGGTFSVSGFSEGGVSGTTNQVAFFNTNSTVSGSNNLVYSGGTLQVRGTGNTTSDFGFKVRYSGNDRDLFRINGLGKATFGFDTSALDGFTVDPQNAEFSQTAYGGLKVMSLTNSQGYVGYGVGSYKFGIGNNSPQARLDVRAQGTLSSDIALAVRNNGDTVNLLQIQGDGGFVFRNNGNTGFFYYDGTNSWQQYGSSTTLTTTVGATTSIKTNGAFIGIGPSSHLFSIYDNGNFQLEQSTGILQTSGQGGLSLKNGTAPSSNTTDRFTMYSNDIVAGKAVPHFRTEDGDIVKLYTHSAVTTTQGIANALTTLGLLSASTIASSTDTFVTGVTYSANTLTVSQNQGQLPINTTIGLNIKSNTVTAGSFAGNPKKYTVTFSTAYPTTNYSISITGSDNRVFTYESKSTTGFVINTNANTTLTGNVDWQTIAIGES